MKTRNLRSFTQNLFLGGTLLASVAFTSCSRTLTSLRSSEKLENQEALANVPAKATTPTDLVFQNKGSIAPIAQTNSNVLLPIAPKSNLNHSWVKAKSRMLAAKSTILNKSIVKTAEHQFASVQNIAKSNQIMSTRHTDRSMWQGSVRRGIILIVVALILYLIGALLFWPAGEVFYIIATIFLIVGLIYLLFGLLGTM